jgi:hypothetical protein
MPGEGPPDREHGAARPVLIEALEAPGTHLKAVVLVDKSLRAQISECRRLKAQSCRACQVQALQDKDDAPVDRWLRLAEVD